jgi:hypothetical protein
MRRAAGRHAVPEAEHAFRFWRVRSGFLEGISSAFHLRQQWKPGVTTATTRCSVDPRHEAPAPDCVCGLYVVPDLPTAVGYIGLTTLGRQPSTPVALGAVLPIGPRRAASPRPLGDPPDTVRVGSAKIVGPLYVFPGDATLCASLAERYVVPVLPAATPDFRDWLSTLAEG